jgi:enamine deaminase RidA (YjgF/YER057c/UK114 family)
MKYWRFIDVAGGWQRYQRLLGVLQDVAGRHQVSIANIACRAILDQPAVGGIIVGARLGESEHLDDTTQLFGFALDRQSHQAIDAAVANLLPVPGDCGDEYRKAPFLTASGDLSHHLESMPAAYEIADRPAGRTSEGRKLVLSGTSWETLAGYCRALRHGDRILVSGTTATHGDRVIGGDDPAAQLHFIIDKIEGALQCLGAELSDIVRTRLFVRDLDDWEAVARAHGERFGAIQPANTLVQAGLVGAAYRVEMEAEAVVMPSSP